MITTKHLLNKIEREKKCLKVIAFCFYLILIMGFTGCMEIENRIAIQEDSSAIIKESIRINKELLDFTGVLEQKSVGIYYFRSATSCFNRLFLIASKFNELQLQIEYNQILEIFADNGRQLTKESK